ncbi:MAG: hypothetical protein WCV62_03125 [Candidatus Peribacteraceae bacterium]|jgi:hypothetical protein
MHLNPRSRPGFVFLLSVLAVGVIAAATAASLLLLGGAAEHTAYSVEQSMQALEFARSCVERGILEARNDMAYGGQEYYSWPRGSCLILPIGFNANAENVFCAEGRSGLALRRLEVEVTQLFPQVKVRSWNEVKTFTNCPTT